MKCRLCNKTAHEIGGYLTRVNEKGVPGVWECRPSCDADLPQDTRVLLAIEGEDAQPGNLYAEDGDTEPHYDR